MNNRYLAAIGATLFALTPVHVNGEETSPPNAASIDTGRYLVTIAGCNDCHTANWMETNGAVTEQDWLTGVPIGWRGPWGTSYASNLRLLANDLDEDAWVEMLKTRNGLPPMPWVNVSKLKDDDARAIYRFIESLGPGGERMPAAVPPSSEPGTAYFNLEPVSPE